MPVQIVNLDHVAMVADRLDPLGVNFAFIGGAVVALLVDHPAASFLRPTKDVDAVFEILTHLQYTKLEERLREHGFRHDMSEGAPRCRWIVGDVKLDVLPARDELGQWSGRWLEDALTTAAAKVIKGRTVKVITAPYFIAAKMDAFEADDRAAFVAECKVWGGPKGLSDAIDQLLGYLTWRDCKAAIVIYNKHNKGFTEIRDQIPQELSAHPRFKNAVPIPHEGEWRIVLRSKDDDARLVHCHVFAFNLYQDTKT